MEYLSVDFLLKETGKGTRALPFPVISRIGVKRELIQSFQGLVSSWKEKRPGYSVEVRGYILLILHRLLEITFYRADSLEEDPRIERLTRYIAVHYPERITLGDLARLADLSPAYLGSLFRREKGLAFNQYLTRVRIKNAENMLRSGEYRVAEVAELCGFADANHFDKRFKEITGLSPSRCIPKRHDGPRKRVAR